MMTNQHDPAARRFRAAVSAALSLIMILSMAVVPCAAQESTGEQLSQPTNGMVSAAHPMASEIGAEVLKNGGNAVDAAVAVAFALGMAEPAASGIGGYGLMLVYDASTGKTTSINYLGECPGGMTLEMHRPENKGPAAAKGMTGNLATVPGFVAGMLKANAMFGTKGMDELLAPAIDLAENGVEVSAFMAEQYLNYSDSLILNPETERVFTYEGFPYMEGDIFTNPDYANTLRLIAEKGFDGFYRGEVAQDIVTSLQRAGGVMTLDDLSNYMVEIGKPYTTDYRGYQVAAAPAPSNGAVVLASLNLAELFPIGSYEHNSPKYLHLWSEIFKTAFGDNVSYIYDPDFRDETGAIGMTTKAYARSRKNLIKMDSCLSIGPTGYPFLYAPKEIESHTTHLSVIDKDGNMVSMTNSNGNFFGCQVAVQNRGFLMNNVTLDYTLTHEKPQAGLKPRSNMCPVMLFYPDGTPYAALGTPGSQRIITTDTLLVSNLIDFNMDLQSALDAPRFYQGRRGATLTLEGGIGADTLKALEEMGHTVKEYSPELSDYFGGAHAVSRDQNGVFHGAADPRRSGAAVGY